MAITNNTSTSPIENAIKKVINLIRKDYALLSLNEELIYEICLGERGIRKYYIIK